MSAVHLGPGQEPCEHPQARDRPRGCGSNFEGPTVERIDERFEYGEIRIYAIGLVNGIEITVIDTDRDDDERHIISAWRAEPHERRYYWQNFQS